MLDGAKMILFKRFFQPHRWKFFTFEALNKAIQIEMNKFNTKPFQKRELAFIEVPDIMAEVPDIGSGTRRTLSHLWQLDKIMDVL